MNPRKVLKYSLTSSFCTRFLEKKDSPVVVFDFFYRMRGGNNSIQFNQNQNQSMPILPTTATTTETTETTTVTTTTATTTTTTKTTTTSSSSSSSSSSLSSSSSPYVYGLASVLLSVDVLAEECRQLADHFQ
jgi:hypothetical protein